MTLPEGWVETTLSEIVTFNPKHDPASDLDQLVSFVPMPAVDEHSGTITSAIDRPLREVWGGFPHFADGDVIFAKITPCMENGKSAIARNLKNGLACGSTEFFVLRPSKGVQASYIWRYLRQRRFRATAETQMTGAVGQRRVPRAYLESYLFRLPPAAEQRRIVAKLDALTARLARARVELDRTTILTRRLRSEVLARYFSNYEAAMPFGDLLTGIEAGRNLRCEERPPQAGERGVVKVSAVTWGRFDAKQSKTLPEDYTPPASAKIRAGDLLISRANTLELVGATVLVDEEPNEIYLSDKILRLVMPDADKRWVMWFLRSQAGRREIEQRATGNQLSMRNISQGALRAISVPYPNADFRKAAVKTIEAAFSRADRLEAEAARARALLDRLEAAILARAFHGELEPQDPNDEPASVVLDRIRAERAAAPKPKRGRARKAVG